VLVLNSQATDQFLAAQPEYVLEAGAEEARIDPENVEILLQHLKCAAFELPFAKAEGVKYAALDAAGTHDALEYLSRQGLLYSGETGFDIYTRAVSDVYQDLFGEGIFTGKGIYEVDAFRESLEHRFPANTLLSHDLIEGLFARAGLVSDIELVDDYPSHFSAYCRRRHRWMRGDWQILQWLLNRVPDFQRRRVDNRLGAIQRWKIFDNLRRTLVEPSMLVLLLVAWFALPEPGAWTMAAVAVLLAPNYWRLLCALVRAPWFTSSFRRPYARTSRPRSGIPTRPAGRRT